ncbi:MAG: helix-turn-helix domain-containing protein, partial [Syntrophales bacterium]|nr:helix-turn-helix domain-containing protein [Syntrophales bacterium]
WPGNVRELKAVMDYAINMSDGSVIAPESLPPFVFSRKSSPSSPADQPILTVDEAERFNLDSAVKRLEKSLIEEALAKCKNKTEAIMRLGISRGSFYFKIKQYGIDG